MTAQHTPAPWRISARDGSRYVIPDDEHGSIAKVRLRRSIAANLTELDANARLISAAPELLAALEAMIGLTSRPASSSADWNRIQTQARAVVAKAGGYQWPPAAGATP